MENDILIKEIDSAHFSANDALKNKNFESYAQHFSESLKYKQINGRTIDKKKLISDIAIYFDRIIKFSSDYKRTDFEVLYDKIIERLIQKSEVAIRIFIFFSKKWTVEREGIYEWKKYDNQWKITSVEIINEKVY